MKYYNDSFNIEPNYDLPFFAYGVFRPGEISFLGIKDYVEEVECATIAGTLMLWDGVLLYEPFGTKTWDDNGRYISDKEKTSKSE